MSLGFKRALSVSALNIADGECCSPITAPAALPITEMAFCTPPAESPSRSDLEETCCSGPTVSIPDLAVVDA